MNPDLKAKWLSALRSGEFKQGKNALHTYDDNAFCCLGVLCVVADLKELEIDNTTSSATYIDPISGNTSSCFVPSDYADSISLRYQAQCDLSEMNDKGKSFSEIATYIEEKL